MIKYKVFEEAIYRQLVEWRDAYGWHFSQRVTASAGAENDRFIGTKKSKYFGTTFWNISAGYGGKAGDTINVFFTLGKRAVKYKIELNQTRSPQDAQNEAVLEFVQSFRGGNDALWSRVSLSPDENKQE